MTLTWLFIALVSVARSVSGQGVVAGTVYGVTGVPGGSGYLYADGVPTITFAAAPSGGISATGTAIMNWLTGVISSINITNAGAGYYTSPPSITISGGTGAASAPSLTASVVPLSTSLGVVGSVSIVASQSIFTNSVPFVTFSGGGASGTASATGTAVVTNGAISGVTITDPGYGHTSAPTIAFGGVLATVTATCTCNVIALSSLSAGSGYTSAPTLTLSGTSITAGSYSVSGISVSSGVVSITGATVTPSTGATCTNGAVTATFSQPTGTPFAAAATATCASNVMTIAVTTSGFGFVTAPTITISGATGSYAATAAIANGAVSSITMTTQGTACTTGGTTVSVGSPLTISQLVQAAASLAVPNEQVVSSTGTLTVTPSAGGTGYALVPTITFSSPSVGITATATATVSSGAMSTITITNPGSGYTCVPTFTLGNTAVTAVVTGACSGNAIALTLVSGGTGYLTAPTITLPTGYTATATVSSGAVSVPGSATAASGATCTTGAVSVTVGAPAGASGAVFTVVVADYPAPACPANTAYASSTVASGTYADCTPAAGYAVVTGTPVGTTPAWGSITNWAPALTSLTTPTIPASADSGWRRYRCMRSVVSSLASCSQRRREVRIHRPSQLCRKARMTSSGRAFAMAEAWTSVSTACDPCVSTR